LIGSGKKHALFFLRENRPREESVRVKESLEGCTKEHKKQLELFQAYKEVFKGPKGLPLEREVDHEIQLLHDSQLPNIRLYR